MVDYMPYFIYLLIFMGFFVHLIGRQKNGWQIFTLVTCFVYLAALGYLCFAPPLHLHISGFGKMKPYWVGPVPTNPIPFRGLGVDVILNVLMTFPMGVYLLLFNPSAKFKHSLYLGIITGFSIEMIQFILDWAINLKRWVDVNDVMMNTLGVVVGWFIMSLIISKLPILKRLT